MALDGISKGATLSRRPAPKALGILETVVIINPMGAEHALSSYPPMSLRMLYMCVLRAKASALTATRPTDQETKRRNPQAKAEKEHKGLGANSGT